MSTFKTFGEWLQEHVFAPDPLQQQKVVKDVGRQLGRMPPDVAMKAVKGIDDQAQKRLVAGTMRKAGSGVNSIGDVAQVANINQKGVQIPQSMRMGKK